MNLNNLTRYFLTFIRISDLLKDIGVVKDVVELVVTFEDEDGGDVDGPIIKFWNASK